MFAQASLRLLLAAAVTVPAGLYLIGAPAPPAYAQNAGGLQVAAAVPAPTPAPTEKAKSAAAPTSQPCDPVNAIPVTETQWYGPPTAAPSTVPAATFCLAYRTAPGIGFSTASPSALQPNPAPDGTPIPIVGLEQLGMDATATLKQSTGLVFAFKMRALESPTPSPSPDAAASASSGPTASPTPFPRLLNGVPLADNEYRFAIILERQPDNIPSPVASGSPPALPSGDDNRLVVEINTVGACYETGSMLTDDLLGSCKVSAFASPSPRPTSSASAGPPSPASAAPSSPASVANPWQAEVTIPWTALNELFARPLAGPLQPADPSSAGVRGPVYFRICYDEGPEPPAAARAAYYRTIANAVPKPASTSAACTAPLVIVFRQEMKGSPNFSIGGQTSNNSNNSSSGSSESAGRSRTLAAAANATPSPTASTNGLPINGTDAQPFNAYWQLSAEGNYQPNLLQSLNQQTGSTLASVVQQQASQQIGKLVPGGLGTSTTSTGFKSVDVDILDRLMPSAFRGYSDASTTLTNQPEAFDSTDVLDLEPFNPTLIDTVTVGAKIASVSPLFNADGQRLGVGGVGWFHDATTGESGTIFHIDQDLNPLLSLGFSQIVGNSVTKQSNAYVAYPNPASDGYPATNPPNPLLHSSNTVIGSLLKFGGGNDVARPFQLFTRYGTTGYGSDWTAALSGASLGSGTPVTPNGASLSFAGLAGYRAIGYDYAPLLGNYDPFAGNQIYFGRANVGFTQPPYYTNLSPGTFADRSDTITDTFSVAGVYAENGGLREYGSFGVSPSIPLESKPNPQDAFTTSLTGSYQLSYISSTVLARQSGSVVIPPGPLNLLDNDQTSINFQLQNSDAFLKRTSWTLTATAGLSFVHSPSCSAATTTGAAPSCSSSYSNKVTWTLNAGSRNFVAYANTAPGSTRTNPTSVSPSIPANSIVTTALVAFHYCGRQQSGNAWGAEPSLTYKNNIAQDGSAFQPGTLVEAGIDIGPGNGIAIGKSIKSVFSIAYQNALNTQGTPVALKNNGWSFSLISVGQAIWQAHKSSNDPCLSSGK